MICIGLIIIIIIIIIIKTSAITWIITFSPLTKAILVQLIPKLHSWACCYILTIVVVVVVVVVR